MPYPKGTPNFYGSPSNSLFGQPTGQQNTFTPNATQPWMNPNRPKGQNLLGFGGSMTDMNAPRIYGSNFPTSLPSYGGGLLAPIDNLPSIQPNPWENGLGGLLGPRTTRTSPPTQPPMFPMTPRGPRTGY